MTIIDITVIGWGPYNTPHNKATVPEGPFMCHLINNSPGNAMWQPVDTSKNLLTIYSVLKVKVINNSPPRQAVDTSRNLFTIHYVLKKKCVRLLAAPWQLYTLLWSLGEWVTQWHSWSYGPSAILCTSRHDHDHDYGPGHDHDNDHDHGYDQDHCHENDHDHCHWAELKIVMSGQFHTLAMVLKVFLVWRGAHAINSEEWSWQAPTEKWSQVSLSKGVRCRTAHRRVFWISSYFLWISSRFFLDFFHEKLCQVSLSKAVHCRTAHRRGAINDICTIYFWIQTNIISTLDKYLLQNIFVWTAKCNCLICKMYLY